MHVYCLTCALTRPARRAQHWQMILSRHCPLVQRELSWFQRLLYCSGVWNYLVGGVTTPLFIILPIITIFGGIFPIVISWWAAGARPPAANALALRSDQVWDFLHLRVFKP